ncbi:MAG: 6-phosphofructokinase [Candidatus Njordarchaeia archaeon]
MRIGILTGGGDCQGINAVIRAAVKKAEDYGWDVIGIRYGWLGLLDGLFVPLKYEELDDIIGIGGTILGTSRVNPLRRKDGVKKIKENLKKMKIDAILAIGGDDTLSVAYELSKEGIPVVGAPKTIDNDLAATEYTFGFFTAVEIGTQAIDRILTTAKSHERVFVVEVMGRYAGWIALYSGLAGGAHYIVIPEQPLDLDAICKLIDERWKRGKKYAVIVVAEGVQIGEHELLYVKEVVDEFGNIKVGGIAHILADEIHRRTGKETRAVVLGHLMRGGSPIAFDRILATRFGLMAIELIKKGEFGKMPALTKFKIEPVPLSKAIAEMKTVPKELYDIAKTFFY